MVTAVPTVLLLAALAALAYAFVCLVLLWRSRGGEAAMRARETEAMRRDVRQQVAAFKARQPR